MEKEIKNFFCNALIFKDNFNCLEEIFTNINFFDEYGAIEQNIDLLMVEKKAKIENLFMLIIIFPLIERNYKLRYKINENKFICIFDNIISYRRNKKDIIIQLN